MMVILGVVDISGRGCSGGDMVDARFGGFDVRGVFEGLQIVE